MFRSSSTFDKLLEKATSSILLEPDWPSIMQICDLIRQNDVLPRYALMAIKKKLFSPNPHCSLYALHVLESIVKNCGSGIHDELTLSANCEMLRELAKTTKHENVRQKLLELIQAWTYAFRKSPKHRAMKDTMNLMQADGFKFPAHRETDAMFSADSAPEWTDGDVCHRCRVQFSFVQRKHHCRACGNVFCAQCSQKTTTLPKFGIEKEVRVCDTCFEQATKPSTAPATTEKEKETDLPPEYLSSSLAQQNQTPPRKTEEELREEEELQLALALSKSEAEHKEKEKMRVTSAVHAETRQSPVNTSIARSPSPVPVVDEQVMDPELARYLNRTYWESLQAEESMDRPTSPSAPSPLHTTANTQQRAQVQVNGVIAAASDPEMDEFVQTLKSQVEIFVNRMKSNSSRGRCIANDSSVQTLFMNITAMHSRLFRYIQQQDDARLHYEGLQDKLTQVKDARAALDALREEHHEKLRRQAEEAERQRQLQMAHKLEIMRKKKQEYLQYQRQLALQRIQEQERELHIRQEQQKQQYLMGGAGAFMGSPVHSQQQPPPQPYGPAPAYYHQYGHHAPPPQLGPPMMHHPPQGGPPPGPIPMGMGAPPPNVHQMPVNPMGAPAPPVAPPTQPQPPPAQQAPPMGMTTMPNAPTGQPPYQQIPQPAPQQPPAQPQPQPPPAPPQSDADSNTAELISFD